MRIPLALGSIVLAVAALAACKGGGSGGSGPVPTTNPSTSPGNSSVVYVANSTVNTVTGFLALATAPSITISSGVSSPVALAVDGSRNLYVDNCQPCGVSGGSSSTITVYPQGSGVPGRTITAGLSKPVAMAVTSGGTLYVANQQTSTVTSYAPGSVNVGVTITTGVASPDGVALDSSGNIYVANGAFFPGTVSVYSPGGTLIRTLPGGGVEGVAVDSTGRVYVSNCNVTCGNGTLADSVIVFAPNSTAVAYSITGGISFPTSLALDSSDDLYVANNSLGKANNVTKYASGSAALVATLNAPGPAGIAIDNSGIVFIANGQSANGDSYNTLTEYQNGSSLTVSNGVTTPVAVAVSNPQSSELRHPRRR
jgi:hypothetical protein